MRKMLFGWMIFAMLSCGGPRAAMKVHFLSLGETNQGRALPLHVVPVDEILRSRLDGISAEDWFVGDDADNLTGIQKRVLRGAQTEVIQMERRDRKNDFLVIVDFAEIEDIDQQKLFLGNQFYHAKEVYVLVTRDRLRVVSKSVFNDYMKTR